MKKKILLILPSNVTVISPFSSEKKKQPSLSFGFPIGLGYIAAHLLRNGNYEIKILDANKDELSIHAIMKIIKDFDPEYIGITMYTINSKVAVQLAKEIKIKFKNKIVIGGGPHASACYKILLEKYPFFDFIVIGEGEITMLELLNVLDSREYNRLKDVKGIAYNKSYSSDLIFTGERSLVRDLNKFSHPARNLVDFEVYIKKDNLLPYAVEIMGSRGCTNRCVFCSFQKLWRARKAEDIIKEMKDLIYKYPKIKSFLFFDDNFSADKRRVIELCHLMINEGLNRYMWSCLCRVDQVDEEMLGWMKKAGCVKIMFGVETADPVIMKNLNKKIDLERVKYVIELVTKLGMNALAFFIIGNPGETFKSIKASYNFAKGLKCQSTVWSIMQVYPGTALAEMQPCEDFTEYLYEPEVKNPTDAISANIPAFENPALDRETMKSVYKNIFWNIAIYKAIHHPFFTLKKFWNAPNNATKFLFSLLKQKKYS